MKTKINFKLYLLSCLAGFLTFGCMDNMPEVEDLPSAAVAFDYKIIDNSYQLDYYVGAQVEFTSISKVEGQCTWDFGDGATATGETVTHKFTVGDTYKVKLVIGNQSKTQPIMIKDIVPIMTLDPIEDENGICEVLSTPVNISVELPNPEGLSEEYTWIFPAGTTDADGHVMTTSNEPNPGKIKFAHVGSQAVRLQVKLGGRLLEEGKINVQVAYNKEVSTLYYAVKNGNIMALKLAADKPVGMNVTPYDMGISSGKHPLNILFNDQSLYILDCGTQFIYVNDEDGNMGDGRIQIMAKDGSRMETMLSNTAAAFDDPFYGCIDGSDLYFANRNTGISRIGLTERNKIYSLSEYPYYVQNALLGYYNNGWSYGSMNACFTRIDGTWFCCKTYNGTGIFRFTEADILQQTTTGGLPAPAAGVALSGMLPKSLVWDAQNRVIYFTIYDTGYEGIYRCTPEQLNAIGGSKGALAPYLLKTADGKSVIPITENGKGEGSSGEYIGICQLTLDEATGDVYFGLRSAYPNEVKSGLMRYNAKTKVLEHVVEGVDVYGVAINNNKSKLF
ncbi:MAG: PKD domain-containing protein [Candidatus Symbiothrix sp.]|jgi:PKD repeat protein|nr:PKD domain-containing protein [Candidatus Symbiothrix sp.]